MVVASVERAIYTLGMVGERKAIAAAVLSFYTLLFVLNALLDPNESMRPMHSALAATYGAAFFSLVAGYFWARWYAIGLGLFGFSLGTLAMLQHGVDYPPLFFTATHGVVSLALWGNQVATDFDGRSDWRARFHMDENATRRLGKAVIRVGISLPMLLMYGLAPREELSDGLLAGAMIAVIG